MDSQGYKGYIDWINNKFSVARNASLKNVSPENLFVEKLVTIFKNSEHDYCIRYFSLYDSAFLVSSLYPARHRNAMGLVM